MKIDFEKKKFRRLYEEDFGAQKYPEKVVDKYSEVLQFVDATDSSQDLRAMKAYRFEKLKGDRGNRGEYSLRLGDQFRLVFRLEKEDREETFVVVEVTDYH